MQISLVATIHFHRPELLPEGTGDVISMNPPFKYFPCMSYLLLYFYYHRYNFILLLFKYIFVLIYLIFYAATEVPEVGELMLASFPADDFTLSENMWYVKHHTKKQQIHKNSNQV